MVQKFRAFLCHKRTAVASFRYLKLETGNLIGFHPAAPIANLF